MNKITIECVWCMSRREFNRFTKDTNKVTDKVIDYVSIKNKLIKADPYGQEPNDSIVGLAIINEITRQLHQENIGVTRVIYFFKNLEFEIVNNFKNIIDTYSQREYELILTVIHNNPKIDDKILNIFESVNFIKK
jgi:hypothetical protein